MRLNLTYVSLPCMAKCLISTVDFHTVSVSYTILANVFTYYWFLYLILLWYGRKPVCTNSHSLLILLVKFLWTGEEDLGFSVQWHFDMWPVIRWNWEANQQPWDSQMTAVCLTNCAKGAPMLVQLVLTDNPRTKGWLQILSNYLQGLYKWLCIVSQSSRWRYLEVC